MLKNLVVLAASAAFVGAASANLVNNPGFETGDFTGWTQFGDTSFTFVDNSLPHSGTFEAAFGPLSPGGIEQVLAASSGDQILVTFWARSVSAGTPNSMLVTLDGQTVANTIDYTNTDYVQFSATITVTNNNPLLSFTFTNPPDYYLLDDVSADIVPAPGAAAILGLGGLLAARRRRN